MGLQHWWIREQLTYFGLVQSVWHCPSWYPCLQIGGIWIWWKDHSLDKELAGWLTWRTVAKGLIPRQRPGWVTSGAPQGLVLFSIFVSDIISLDSSVSGHAEACNVLSYSFQIPVTTWEDISAQNGLHKEWAEQHLTSQAESSVGGDGHEHYRLPHTEETV